MSSHKSVGPFTVCGFEAFINGKHIIGEVKEKEQAHKEYREAISKGHGAYLMDEETPVGPIFNLGLPVPPIRQRKPSLHKG